MSNVSRSVYQKLKEENKRLLNDIEILTYNRIDVDCYPVFSKWYKYFQQQHEINNLLKAYAKKYIQDHADELPDFLTKNVNK